MALESKKFDVLLDWQEEEHMYISKAEPGGSSSNMFTLHNTGWKAKNYGGAKIKHLVSASGILYAATDRGRVVRWNLHTGDEQVVLSASSLSFTPCAILHSARGLRGVSQFE